MEVYNNNSKGLLKCKYNDDTRDRDICILDELSKISELLA